MHAICISDCLSKNLHSLYQNSIQFYCHSLQISIHPQCIKCQMFTGLLFRRAFCLTSKDTTGTMSPTKGTKLNKNVSTADWIGCLRTLLMWQEPLCGCLLASWMLQECPNQSILLPTCAHSTPLSAKRMTNTMKFSHQWFRRLAI